MSANPPTGPGINEIQISGFKSLVNEYRIPIRPLTILAGANSSGKSSTMQPLLLLKQTLEASYDPGPLLLDGPNVRFTSERQFLAITDAGTQVNSFTISLKNDEKATLSTRFSLDANENLVISSMKYQNNGQVSTLRPEMTHEELFNIFFQFLNSNKQFMNFSEKGTEKWKISRKRSFLVGELPIDRTLFGTYSFEPSIRFEEAIRHIIHVPGLRGNPTRTYKTTAFGRMFPGSFEHYVASIISHWQETKDKRLSKLEKVLAQLGLTWRLDAKQVDKTQVELRVGRFLRSKSGKANGMINIADVGFGVSQVLPVLVALLVALPRQMVYIEQPEIHLHPRAQAALAEVLIDAAGRGVRVVVETHSSLLLTAIQTRVAQGEIAPAQVMLHWFRRGEDGVTEISSTELDQTGAFGEWPIDFADVEMEIESDYLEAVETKLMGA